MLNPTQSVHPSRQSLLAFYAIALAMVLAACASPRAPEVISNQPAVAMPSSTVSGRNPADEILYFVLVDRFADGDKQNNARVDKRNPGGFHGGDLRGLTQQLDELASLGITALWINPLQKQVDACPYAQAPSNLGIPEFRHCAFHGYWIEDFNRIDPRFGTMQDLQTLVKEAHARGIAVWLDVVVNHTGYGSSAFEGRRTAQGESWIRLGEGHCETDPLTCRVGGLPDVKTEIPEIREALITINTELARLSGVDGFRLDTFKHVDSLFWQAHRQALTAINPRFFLLAEQWGANAQSMKPIFDRQEVDAAFDFSFKGNCEGFVKGRGRPVAFASYLSKRNATLASNNYMVHYLSSHDEPMALSNLDNDINLFRLCVAIKMAIPGIPMIYYGEEVARQGSVWPTNREDMPWGERDIAPGKGKARNEALRNFYQSRIALRKNYAAMRYGSVQAITPRDSEVMALLLNHPSQPLLMLVNRYSQAKESVLALPSPWKQTAQWAPIESTVASSVRQPSAEISVVDNGQIKVKVSPMSINIFALQ